MAIPTRQILSREQLLIASLLAVVVAGAGCAAAGGARGSAAPAPASGTAVSGASPAPAVKAGPAAPGAAASAEDKSFAFLRVPLFDEALSATPVARVDDEVIAMDEIVDALAMSHEAMGDKKASAGKRDALAVLDRIIDMRLFVAEARDMKLDELPELKSAVAQFERITWRELLKKRAVKGVIPDPAEVESKYKDATREWKVKSALFPLEADAKELRAQLDAGKPFYELAKAALESKKATTVTAAEFLPPSRMLPQVRAALEKLQAGGATSPLQVPGGFAVLGVEEIRHRDDPSIRAAAESASVTNRSVGTLRQYYQALIKKYAKVDKAAIDRLNLEAKKPGLEALAKDRRVLVAITGEKPVTVADLVQEIQGNFFHGVDSAVKEKRLNQEKWTTLDQFLFRRLLDKEAVTERITETPEYKKQVAGFAREQIFSTFVGRALLPDVKVAQADIRAYYDTHASEFSYARFYKLDSIAFDTAKDAQGALDKLTAGTDLKWVKEHADGLAKESGLAYQFQNRTLSSKAIPPELAALLAGTKRGDIRLFAADDKKFYVLQVAEETPPEQQPFEEAREVIAKKLYGEQVNAAVKEWARKLREGHEVEVYITRIGG
jgi:hypothetical protein